MNAILRPENFMASQSFYDINQFTYFGNYSFAQRKHSQAQIQIQWSIVVSNREENKQNEDSAEAGIPSVDTVER